MARPWLAEGAPRPRSSRRRQQGVPQALPPAAALRRQAAALAHPTQQPRQQPRRQRGRISRRKRRSSRRPGSRRRRKRSRTRASARAARATLPRPAARFLDNLELRRRRARRPTRRKGSSIAAGSMPMSLARGRSVRTGLRLGRSTSL
eukprot:819376-Pyramimonas_sp.AAC.1